VVLVQVRVVAVELPPGVQVQVEVEVEVLDLLLYLVLDLVSLGHLPNHHQDPLQEDFPTGKAPHYCNLQVAQVLAVKSCAKEHLDLASQLQPQSKDLQNYPPY
jgi:hypothetical protein